MCVAGGFNWPIHDGGRRFVRRKGLFVHAGWVERVGWLPNDRLVIAGFSNFKDGGMVALLDVNAINGQSPVPRNSEFDCGVCGPDRPVRYIVMPRSEVNRISGAPFNRAKVQSQSVRLVVNTLELLEKTLPPTAIYEFTPELDLIHASYSDRYWDAHRDLERAGKISHTREQCPDRDGRPTIEIWGPATGWRTQVLHKAAPATLPAHPPADSLARLTASLQGER